MRIHSPLPSNHGSATDKILIDQFIALLDNKLCPGLFAKKISPLSGEQKSPLPGEKNLSPVW